MLHVLKKIGTISKKVFFVIFVYVLVVGLFMYFMKKDTPKAPKQDLVQKLQKQVYTTINDPDLKKTKTGRLGIGLYRLAICKLSGIACTDSPSDDYNPKYVNESMSGFLTNLMIYPYTHPPASGIYWTYSKLQDSGFIPKTYAAEGIGFAGIKPIIGLWTAFRNIAYMLLVLVLITIGFMIMFRMKLNPQTVISVENALPKIVLSMILITFSFAIAGFLIDLMYVILAIGVGVISNNGLYYNAGEWQKKFISAGPSELFTGFFVKGKYFGIDFAFVVGNSFLWIMGNIISGIIRFIVGIITAVLGARILHWALPDNLSNIFTDEGIQAATFGAEIGKFIKGFIDLGSKNIALVLFLMIGVTLVTPLLVGFIIILTIAGLFFRLLFYLFRTYMQILLYIIFGPLYLLMEAVPGSKIGFQSWFINLFAEIMVFPLIAIIFSLGYVIANTLSPGAANGLWAPPFLFGFNTDAFSVLMGIVLIFVTPDLIKSFKEMLGAKGMGVNFGIGTLFGGGQALASGGMGLIGGFSSIALAFPGLRGMIPGAGGGFMGKLMGTTKPTEEALVKQLAELQGAQKKEQKTAGV